MCASGNENNPHLADEQLRPSMARECKKRQQRGERHTASRNYKHDTKPMRDPNFLLSLSPHIINVTHLEAELGEERTVDLAPFLEPYRIKGGQSLQLTIISAFEEKFAIASTHRRPWLSHRVERSYNK
jgi:hypothetical protein